MVVNLLVLGSVQLLYSCLRNGYYLCDLHENINSEIKQFYVI